MECAEDIYMLYEIIRLAIFFFSSALGPKSLSEAAWFHCVPSTQCCGALTPEMVKELLENACGASCPNLQRTCYCLSLK